MVRLSLNETTTFRWSFEEDVRHYSEAGIPAIGVWRHKLSDCGKGCPLTCSKNGPGVFCTSTGRWVYRLRWPQFRASVDDALEASAGGRLKGLPRRLSGDRAGTRQPRQTLEKNPKELAPQPRISASAWPSNRCTPVAPGVQLSTTSRLLECPSRGQQRVKLLYTHTITGTPKIAPGKSPRSPTAWPLSNG